MAKNKTIISLEPKGVRIRTTADITVKDLVSEMEEAGYRFLSPQEAETLVTLFACDEIFMDQEGDYYYHANYAIRDMTEEINQSRDRDIDRGIMFPTGVLFPKLKIQI